MTTRSQNSKPIELNVVGSSVFGRYAKISAEKTYNMFISQDFLVPYAGYKIAIPSDQLSGNSEGRGIFTSTKLDCLIIVIGNQVFRVTINYNQQFEQVIIDDVTNIGTLLTGTGVVYIAENNKPQVGISDGSYFYIYDPLVSAAIKQVTTLNFTPGYLTFHDTYFILAASNDNTYIPPANNTWRLSGNNDGTMWPSTSMKVGLLQTKPDNVQAVVRFPSKGNMILVMGSIVTEAWNDLGLKLFPYARQNQFNIDYGCLSPATVAYMDEIVVWLASNEKSGPIIMYSEGGQPKKITTDGIDYLFSTLQNPEDSQAFLYQQDGHLFYHINFYSDNFSLYYDFNTGKFYNACDQNLNYFIASEVAFFNNQYYFVTRNNGNIFAFDTAQTTYQDVDNAGNVVINEIPRFRVCKNIRQASQDYFIVNDIGFTIETGETNYQNQFQIFNPIQLITQDEMPLITQGTDVILLLTQDGNLLVDQSNDNLYFQTQQTGEDIEYNLIAQQSADQSSTQFGFTNKLPRVDLSISIDGGATFGNEWGYELNSIGLRKNRLMWWQCGMANDLVCQFKFWGMGRVVITDGVVNIRT